jgi:hypothetical protein
MVYLTIVSVTETRRASSGAKIKEERAERDLEAAVTYFMTLPGIHLEGLRNTRNFRQDGRCPG